MNLFSKFRRKLVSTNSDSITISKTDDQKIIESPSVVNKSEKPTKTSLQLKNKDVIAILENFEKSNILSIEDAQKLLHFSTCAEEEELNEVITFDESKYMKLLWNAYYMVCNPLTLIVRTIKYQI